MAQETKKKCNHNNLITIRQSIPKSVKETKLTSNLNRWRSSKDVDLTYISQSNTKHSSSETTHKITFLSTNYDTQMNVDKEENDIKNLNFEFTRSILTLSDLKNVLIESPPIVHISTHGFHKYKTDKHTAFQIALEEPQTFRYLLDEHATLSAFYAAVAILFEMEVNHFVQYGFKIKQNNNNNQPLITSIWKDNIVLNNDKIYTILINILNRFGCCYLNNTAAGRIEIFWGQYNNSLKFIGPPHPPIDSYQLSTLYQHDEQVQQILNVILDDYNESDTQHLREYEQFSWGILIDNIFDYLPKDHNAMTDSKICDDMHHIDADIDDIAAFGFMDDDDEKTCFANGRLTNIKFGSNQDLTREIKIIPLNVDEKQELKQQVSAFKNKVIHLLRKTPDIQISLDVTSTVPSNVHIVRFVNESALALATQRIDEIRRKYSHDYDILFRLVSKSDNGTQKQVGFIAKTQEKIYSIDIKNKTDAISSMLKKYLKSKKECKIKLLVLNGCHSYILGKIFSEYVENVICIHPFVKIFDSTATAFTKHFYQSLQKYINPRILFSHSVLHAYNIAKTNIAKECSNDFACASHSHLHPITYYHNQYIQETVRRSEELRIHFNENWSLLQNHINNEILFEQYRERMKQSCVIMNEPIDNLYDGKTLIISNISEKEMNDIRIYLEEYKGMYEDKKEDFVQKAVYQKNECYPELSVAYFKFKTIEDSNEGKKILSQKQYDEEIIFSKQMLKSYLKYDEKGQINEDDIKINNLGWIYRIVPRCCCSPFYPHIAKDKFILLQNGNIVNRSIINSKSEIKNGLQKISIRQKQRQVAKKL